MFQSRLGTPRVRQCALLIAALAAVLLPLVTLAARPHPAQALVERGVAEMRTNPDKSKRDAEAALEIIKREPNPDLEIRARLVLCDYLSERDGEAAQQEISKAEALLP